jgi:glycosyltransferase involved in cell wall biosynthesis
MSSKKKENKKIVIFYSMLVDVGGAERLALEEVRYFSRNHDAWLFTFKLNPEALFGYKDVRLKVIDRHRESDYYKVTSSLKRAVTLARELKKINCDLVIACSTAGLHEMFLASLIYPVPYILHIHGTIFWFEKDPLKYAFTFKPAFNTIRQSLKGHMEFVPQKLYCSFPQNVKKELVAVLNYFAVKRGRRVLVLGNHMRWEVQKLYHKNSIVLPLTCFPEYFQGYVPKIDVKKHIGVDQNTKIMLSISRLDPRKRIDLLIKAFAQIHNELDDTVLVIGGKGSEKPKLETLAKKLGIPDKVKLVGFIPENELWDYYASCDIFAYPGWSDFAMTIYEAYGFNKKIVCSSEIEIPLRSNVFRTKPTVKDFANTLKVALNAPLEKIDFRELTWDNYFRQLEQIVHQAMEKNR